MTQIELDKIIEKNRVYTKEGRVATYIPGLASANPNNLGVVIVSEDGTIMKSGDCDVRFAIESISKTIVLALALLDNGPEGVFRKIGQEPTGDAFNSIKRLETGPLHRPSNPYINAGAIATASLIKGNDPVEKFNRVLDFMKKISEDDSLYLDSDIYLSEKETGDTNRALAYYMKSYGDIEGNVDAILDVYFKQCSISVTAETLAKIGMFFARDGVLSTGERVMPEGYAKIITGLMITCGLYNESGEYLVEVGVATKSGVGGGLLATVPGKYGIGTFSPPLDPKGNSTAGIKVMKDVVEILGVSIL
ncbi:glutaminase A [Cetobacterium sp. 2A]|uniref:glutaminase A n=1 Tax=unclassified Cetobacterium TaxID=2630983 RepID=UPI00163CE4E3|nr:glutaminase A [Cetobacterium sp. 2A]MBC2855569.1 glutaminase A [Cetobacterium sp. 2A]